MEENKPENQAAFPIVEKCLDNFGMTLRDYFAAKAMLGFIALEGGMASGGFSSVAESTAHHSYIIADAMLKERLK